MNSHKTQDSTVPLNTEHPRSEVRDAEKQASDAGTPPTVEKPGPVEFIEGGLSGWLVVLGATIVLGCSFGYVNAFGVYQTYYQHNQLAHKTSSEIAWIGSIQLFFMFGSGLFAGGLFDRYGARALLVPATITYVLSIMMTSLCTEYYQFILAQGLLAGVSNGFLFTPATSAINHYFRKKRGVAFGIAAMGSSLGGVIFPIVLEQSFNSKALGFGWGVRITGFGVMFFLAIACILIKERFRGRTGSLFAPRSFCQANYSFLVAGLFLLIWGVFVPLFFVASYGVAELHMSSDLAFYLLAILNATSLFGRIISGATADKLGPLNMLTFTGICNTVLIFSWPSTDTNAGLIVWTGFFGFTSGAIFTLFPAAFASTTPQPHLIGRYIGQGTAVLACSGLTGSPIAGAIVTKYGFEIAVYFAGASMIGGSILIMAARLSHNRKLLVAV